MVLGNLMVDEADDIGTNGGLEDCGEADRSFGRLLLLGVDGDQRTRRGQRLKKCILFLSMTIKKIRKTP